MSDFSPQAQAVLDASHFPQRWEHAIAAALRAATDHLKSIDPDDNAYSAGYDTAISDLLAIAYELDGNYPEKPDSSIDSNLKAKLTSYQSVPASLVPMEYADLESGARIVCEPSEEGFGACWNVLNFSGIHSFEEFPTVQAAWQAMQRVKEAQG